MTWLPITEYLCHKYPRICSICRNHNTVLSLFMRYHQSFTIVTHGCHQQIRNYSPFWITRVAIRFFGGVRVAQSLVFCVVFFRSHFVLLSLFFLAIVLFDHRFTVFDYPFGINLFLLSRQRFICILPLYDYFSLFINISLAK